MLLPSHPRYVTSFHPAKLALHCTRSPLHPHDFGGAEDPDKTGDACVATLGSRNPAAGSGSPSAES
eukprot:4115721-Prorocentrum_lima.AAC.1